MISQVGEHQWEDVNWNDEGHRNYINTELGTYCRLLYPLGTEVVCRPGLLLGWCTTYVLSKFSR
jgi:hypothetical protein